MAKKKTTKFPVRRIRWGSSAAEDDKHLLKYFVPPEDLNSVVEFDETLVIGRKGSGKSAILAHVEHALKRDRESVVVTVRPSIEVLAEANAWDALGVEMFSVIAAEAWQAVMLETMTKVIGRGLKDKLISKAGLKLARNFVLDNGHDLPDPVEAVNGFLNRLMPKAVEWGDKKVEIATEARKEFTTEDHVQVAKAVAEDSKLVFLVDDVDRGWRNTPFTNNLLRGLMLAWRDLNRLHDSIHCVLFMRNDVHEVIRQGWQERDKTRDAVRLMWNADAAKRILAARIRHNAIRSKWDSDLSQLDAVTGNRSDVDKLFRLAFPRKVDNQDCADWIFERTLGRPRDVLQFARFYTEKLETDKPSVAKIKEVQLEYAREKTDDLSAEFTFVYPGLDKFFDVWERSFPNQPHQMHWGEFSGLILNVLEGFPNAQIPEWAFPDEGDADPHLVADVLYQTGVIGDLSAIGSEAVYAHTKYKTVHSTEFNAVEIHPCFAPALNIVPRDDWKRSRSKEDKKTRAK